MCVIDRIPFQNYSADVKRYAHMSGIPVHSELNHVDLLIGQDNSAVLIPLEVKRGKSNDQPFQVKMLLRWSIHGVVNENCAGYCNMIYNRPRTSATCHLINGLSKDGGGVQIGSVDAKLDRLWEMKVWVCQR